MPNVVLKRFRGLLRVGHLPNLENVSIDAGDIEMIGVKTHLPKADIYVASVSIKGFPKEMRVMVSGKIGSRNYNLKEDYNAASYGVSRVETPEGSVCIKRGAVTKHRPAGLLFGRKKTCLVFDSGNKRVCPLPPTDVEKSLHL